MHGRHIRDVLDKKNLCSVGSQSGECLVDSQRSGLFFQPLSSWTVWSCCRGCMVHVHMRTPCCSCFKCYENTHLHYFTNHLILIKYYIEGN